MFIANICCSNRTKLYCAEGLYCITTASTKTSNHLIIACIYMLAKLWRFTQNKTFLAKQTFFNIFATIFLMQFNLVLKFVVCFLITCSITANWQVAQLVSRSADSHYAVVILKMQQLIIFALGNLCQATLYGAFLNPSATTMPKKR